jgi:hypothetical protein
MALLTLFCGLRPKEYSTGDQQDRSNVLTPQAQGRAGWGALRAAPLKQRKRPKALQG